VYEPVREERHDDVMTELPTDDDDDDELTDYGGHGARARPPPPTTTAARRTLHEHDDGDGNGNGNFTMRKRQETPRATIPKQFIQPPPPPPELLATSPTPTTSSSNEGRVPQWSCGSLTSDYDSATVSSVSTGNVYKQVVSKVRDSFIVSID